MIPLSSAVRLRVEKLFPASIRAEVIAVLEEHCGESLPMMAGRPPEDCDRVRCAVLKLSCGNFVRLLAAVADAKVDWRDTLMAAGFGHDVRAHEAWLP